MSEQPAILVTGGAGYIGSHGCRALAAAGYHPVVFDNFDRPPQLQTGSLVVGDLVDRAALARAFAAASHRARSCHFAASSLVGNSVADPQKSAANQCPGTLSLLAAMLASARL